ncbi:4'-phosphopantetheinyl transferase family protein [Agrobacterium sp. DKPNP3]|uniref:4'-phosphopantetheinyl transferase family protein n=1 Tax=Agrobacterium sp. DKPNP3 TaxID=3457323 RepID=UPI004044ED66
MSGIIWHSGDGGSLKQAGDQGLVWHFRLDEVATERMAGGATLSRSDFEDLASRPDAGVRGLRRRLVKVLLARASGLHPDEIIVGRTQFGGPHVFHPTGWHMSVGGRFPHCLIGLSRAPIGVDIEPLDAEPPPDDSFTDAEAVELHGGARTFLLSRWAAKEAHAKCLGIASRIEAVEIETRLYEGRLSAVSSYGATEVFWRVEGEAVQAAAILQPDA